MRSVPHRVVCLLGLDDGAFPRKAPRDGDDLMLDDPHVGERDPRTEDRQLLLDALLAATDRLIVTYTGNDERTNAPRPPAVPVGELLDVVDAHGPRRRRRRARARSSSATRCSRSTRATSPRRARRATAPWSFDRVTLDGRARAGGRARRAARRSSPAPLPARRRAASSSSTTSCASSQHPVRAFLRQRLGISVGDFADEVEDALPVELDGLETWGVGQRLLDARLAGVDGRRGGRGRDRARRRCRPACSAEPVIDERRARSSRRSSAEAAALVAGGASPGSVDVRVDARGRPRAERHRAGRARRRAAHGHLLARDAPAPARGLGAAARADRRAPGARRSRPRRSAAPADARRVTIARIRPLGADADEPPQTALEHLAVLVDLYDRGMREPLPLACLTSAAYARGGRATGATPWRPAARAWDVGAGTSTGRTRSPSTSSCSAACGTFDELLAEPPRADEAGRGWDAGETTRFGRYARRLWDGLLACEEVSDR